MGDNEINDAGITMAVFNEFKEGLNNRLDKTDTKIDKVDVKVDNLHEKVNGLELKLTEYRTETRQFRHEFDQNTKYRCHQHESTISQLKDKQAIFEARLNTDDIIIKDDKISLVKKIISKVLPRDWKTILITGIIVAGVVLIVLGIFTDVLG